jgi:hypothetical protein
MCCWCHWCCVCVWLLVFVSITCYCAACRSICVGYGMCTVRSSWACTICVGYGMCVLNVCTKYVMWYAGLNSRLPNVAIVFSFVFIPPTFLLLAFLLPLSQPVEKYSNRNRGYFPRISIHFHPTSPIRSSYSCHAHAQCPIQIYSSSDLGQRKWRVRVFLNH